MKKVSLLFGIHMHQPVDNFDESVQEAIDLCYEPFFQTMAKYPAFKFSVHCSGWLLDKIKNERPELFATMQSLTKAGAIEWFGAGYYEPVLSSIPSKDRRAQIKKLSNYIRKHFKVKPRGLWLTERVWEASLVSDLRACGIEYATVDDYHFLSNGYDEDNLKGYHVTEDNAQELKLFAISKELRYAMPFAQVDDAVAAILSHTKDDNAAAIIFDDAEKFGLWPETNKWVYGEKWLEKFVIAILENENIKTQHYGNYADKNKSLGLCYLDNCSYVEMGEWSLQPEQTLNFVKIKEEVRPYVLKGGIWKNFFIKYSESNYLHKRMLGLSLAQKEFDKYTLDALYKLQTNDVFWHGVFGGLYLPSLRDNAYKYLLEIELQRAKKEISFEVCDSNKDGYDDLKVMTPAMSMLVSAKNGAQLIELGAFDVLFNWQNTLMRRKEAYHEKLLNAAQTQDKVTADKEVVATIHDIQGKVDESLQELLVFDWHEKNSFVDHFSDTPFSLENFKSLTYRERGDFANEPFVLKDKKFLRKGALYLNAGVYPAKMQKKYTFLTNGVILKSKLTTDYDEKLYFAQELNLHFAHPYKVTFNDKTLEDDFSAIQCKELRIVDDFTNKVIVISMSEPCDIYAFILETVSKSESGYDKIAQQISFILSCEFTATLRLETSLEVKNV